MRKRVQKARRLHSKVPANWYYKSINIDKNLLQRFVHGRRFAEVSRQVEKVGGKILDVGAADGTFTKVILESSGAEKIIGIDILKESVYWAREKYKKEGRMEFGIGDAHKLEYKSATFDAVFALEILEHVSNPVKVLKEIKRVLKKGGYAVFLVPTESLLFRIVWYLWTKHKGRVWQGTHIHHFGNEKLIKLIKESGLAVEAEKKILGGTLHLIKVRK
jgi:ubiquinone/menaquinone biosynthesis C-methylase UbiE